MKKGRLSGVLPFTQGMAKCTSFVLKNGGMRLHF